MDGEFSDKQVKVLKEVVVEAVKVETRDLKEALQQGVKDEIRLNNDLIFQEIRATENRLRTEIKASEERTISAVGQMLDESIHPQLDDHDKRITKLERAAAGGVN